jgi:soluble lytic murein transglycosylase-like protein
MIWRTLPAILILLIGARARADLPLSIVPPPADQLCRQAVAAAERAHGIPAHLLSAIARVESGRRDQATGTFNPWPWTINMDGEGSFYESREQAVSAARTMRPHVAVSIDVGCMQISLVHHPDAFASLSQAFDPAANADYAARFLLQLYETAGSWPRAVALYHSATPELGQDYQRKVYAAWPEEERVAGAVIPAVLPRPWGGMVAPATLPIARQQAGRIIPLATAPGGMMPPGRTLEMYRARPVRQAWRLS